MMNEINKKYELGFTAIPLSSLKIIDPGTMKYEPAESEDEYYPLSDTAMKQLSDILELPGKKFSMDLYEVDADLWKQLISRKLISNNVKNSMESKSALIINDMIINYYNGSPYLNDVLNLLNEYIEAEELTSYTEFLSTDTLTLISVNKDHVGNMIKYYFQDNYIVVYDCYYNHEKRELILAPYYAVDSAVNEDTYSIANKELCYNASAVSMPQSLPDLTKELKETYMSAEEVINYFKKMLKIKLKIEPIDALMYGADNDYSNQSINHLRKIIDILYNDEQFISRINTNYIKKTIYITGVSYYDFIQLLTSRMIDGQLDCNYIRDVEFACLKHSTHFAYLRS